MLRPCRLIVRNVQLARAFSNQNATKSGTITVNKKEYETDNWTNITPRIQSYINSNIYMQKNHPLSIVRQEVVRHFHNEFRNRHGNAIFSVYDNWSPVVTTQQNFDELLVPVDHVSRRKSDSYYLNQKYMLRAHTTAHQAELVRSGLNNFLVVGDVYRRDEIDATHYPVFHQLDAVRIVQRDNMFFPDRQDLHVFEANYDPRDVSQFIDVNAHPKCIDQYKQPCHSLEAVRLIEHEMKQTLVGLAKQLFGSKIEHRWVDAYFPFTHPSWELEILHDGKWIEVLGSGIIRNEILAKNGVHNSIGWAFGLGLERLAMVMFKIPDIRLFWSNDTGFLSQFSESTYFRDITYKPISVYPHCKHDISFWLPAGEYTFDVNDFYDLVRTVAGDIVEQVHVIDTFKHPKTKQHSYTFRILYRHMERTLTHEEANVFHKKIEEAAANEFNVKIR